MSDFFDIDGNVSPYVNSYNEESSIFALLGTPRDAKSVNYYQYRNSVIVESVADYLDRIIAGTRSAGAQVTMLLPKAGYEPLASYTKPEFASALVNFDTKYYTFIGGLADVNFVEIEFFDTPFIGENGNWWIGETDTGIAAAGPKGDKGDDGDTPTIGENGNWWIGETDTGVKAAGEDGEDGAHGSIIYAGGQPNTEGNTNYPFTPAWEGSYYLDQNNKVLYGPIDAGGSAGSISLVGEDGEDSTVPGPPGTTPTIGENGNWWIGDTDTGVKAAGEDGEDSTVPGPPGTTPTIGENGNWWIGAVDTGVKAAGEDGSSGSDIFQVHFIFDAAGVITYPCPYALKFTAMIHQQTNAPTLSTALNVDQAQYNNFTVTADAAGIVTLTGTWL